MDSEQIEKFTERNSKNISKKQMDDLQKKLVNAPSEAFENLEQTEIKSPFVTVMLSAFLGLFGAGSFYLGRIRAGVLKVTFNVVVPLLIAILFPIWLSPLNYTYYDQSFDIARSIYRIANDTETDYAPYETTHIYVVLPWPMESEYNKAITPINANYSVVAANDEISFPNLKSDAIAAAYKEVFDTLGLKEVKIEDEEGVQTDPRKIVSIKIGFKDLLPTLSLDKVDEFAEKFGNIKENAANLLEKINNVNTDDKDVKNAVEKLKEKVDKVFNSLEAFLTTGKENCLEDCLSLLQAQLLYYSDLNGKLQKFYSETVLSGTVEKKLNFKQEFQPVISHLDNAKAETDLNKIDNEISAAVATINALSSKAIRAAGEYYFNYMSMMCIPSYFLMLDAIIVLCWWIGEVFNDREKCFEYNYREFLDAINR